MVNGATCVVSGLTFMVNAITCVVIRVTFVVNQTTCVVTWAALNSRTPVLFMWLEASLGS